MIWLCLVGLMLFRHVLGPALFYFLFYQTGVDKTRGWKIQEKWPAREKVEFDIRQSFLSMLNDALIILLTAVLFVKGWSHLDFSSSLDVGFSMQDGLVFAGLFFLQDFYFYVTHFLFHHPFVYKRIHKIHHQSTNPTPWTSFSHHFVEGFVELLFYPLILLFLSIRFDFLMMYVFVTTVINFLGHSGFEVPWLSVSRLPGCGWIATYTFHNRHHQYFQGNYSLYFNIWDRVFRTEISKK